MLVKRRTLCSELLCQAWMKPDKSNKAPHVLLVSKRFNEVSGHTFLGLKVHVQRPCFDTQNNNFRTFPKRFEISACHACVRMKFDARVAGESPRRVRGGAQTEYDGARRLHREVGRHRRHLPLHAQLQRRPADLRRLRQQLCVPAQENVGKALETGASSDRHVVEI